MTCSSKRHGSAVSRRRLLSFTPDWKPWSPVRVLRGWRHWAAASRVCGKFGDAVLRSLCQPLMLVDTSIWVEHLRHGQLGLVSLLRRAEVQCHPFIIGELACGSISR